MKLTMLLLIVIIRPNKLEEKLSWTRTLKLMFMMLIQKVLHRANIRIKIGQIGALITSKTIANPDSIKQVTINSLSWLSFT